jgi:hypothetical protein
MLKPTRIILAGRREACRRSTDIAVLIGSPLGLVLVEVTTDKRQENKWAGPEPHFCRCGAFSSKNRQAYVARDYQERCVGG